MERELREGIQFLRLHLEGDGVHQNANVSEQVAGSVMSVQMFGEHFFQLSTYSINSSQ